MEEIVNINADVLKKHVIELNNSNNFRGKDFVKKISTNFPELKKDELQKLVDMIITSRWILNILTQTFPKGSLNKKVVMEKFGYSLDNTAFNLAFEIFSDQRTGNLVSLTGHIKVPTIKTDTKHVSKIFEEIFTELTNSSPSNSLESS